MPGLSKEVIISLNTFSASLFLSLNFCSIFFLSALYDVSFFKILNQGNRPCLQSTVKSIQWLFFIYVVVLFSSRISIWLFFKISISHLIFFVYSLLSLFSYYYLYFLKYIYKSCLSHFFANPQILGFSVTVSICQFLFFSSHTFFFLHIFLLYTEHCQ